VGVAGGSGTVDGKWKYDSQLMSAGDEWLLPLDQYAWYWGEASR